jgi:hypothetical protein
MHRGDRRVHYRLTYYCEAELEGLAVGRVPCRVADIGVGGVFVETRAVLPLGATTRIRFQLAGEDIAADTEVRYSAAGFGMGLRFLNLPDLEQARIRTFILKESSKRR